MDDDFWDKVRNKIGLAIYEKMRKEILESINKEEENEEESTMNELLLHIVNELNKNKENFTTKPTGIKINESWLNKQIAKGFTFVDRETQKRTLPDKLGGIPVAYDDGIETYKIIYGEVK